MKKLIYTLFVLIGLSTVSFAQTSDVAVAEGNTELMASKKTGNYKFTLPANLTKEDVAKNAKYYTRYFTVDFNESAHTATLNVADNDEKNRTVVARFLIACGVNKVKVDGREMEISKFMNAYLK